MICLACMLLAACSSTLGDAEKAYEQTETLGEKCEAATKISQLYLNGPEDRRMYWRSVAGIDCARMRMNGAEVIDGIVITER